MCKLFVFSSLRKNISKLIVLVIFLVCFQNYLFVECVWRLMSLLSINMENFNLTRRMLLVDMFIQFLAAICMKTTIFKLWNSTGFTISWRIFKCIVSFPLKTCISFFLFSDDILIFKERIWDKMIRFLFLDLFLGNHQSKSPSKSQNKEDSESKQWKTETWKNGSSEVSTKNTFF